VEKREIIIGAFSIAALNLIFPPWQVKNNERIVDMGYWWIKKPPQKTNS